MSSKAQDRAALKQVCEHLDELQNVLAAARTHALLVIFQGMDTAGKDSAIRRVFSGVNPQGIDVYSFRRPSDEDVAHDFLWRAAQRLPELGRIAVFNRSYYEDVVAVRVHAAEDLARERIAATPDIWKHRFEAINAFEQHLARNNVVVVKFFLDVSRDEQRKRLLKRLADPKKHWKFQLGDIQERSFWDEYQSAYRAAIDATDTGWAQWYVVPADDKPHAQLVVARTLVSRLERLHLRYPDLEPSVVAQIGTLREELGD